MGEVWNTLWLSLRIAGCATALVAAVAIPLAWLIGRRRFPGKSLVETFITVPLVLPPTVVGYFLITTLGTHGWAGRWLHETFGYSIIFRFEGAVLAAAVVALPLLYLPAKAAFASVNPDLEDMSRVLGAGPLRTFWKISVPSAARGIGSGLVLAFARALGEFGATIMVFGWQPGRQTLPISIYSDYEQGELSRATPAVVILLAVSLMLIGLYNLFSAGGRSKW
ncbi:MAG: molybdate ABC transporter permease subunit [Planctomycetes bacterium]|nr:molybdate ABC transporter permease subunit [Planctomycetota bacterium]